VDEHFKYTFFIKFALGVEMRFFSHAYKNPKCIKSNMVLFWEKLDVNGKSWILEIQFVRGCFKEKQEYIILDRTSDSAGK
jgi:hypothetical protein